ncbi:MAG: Hpt domain-containing protein [Planctomycetes bacterium]|nr:Hpt domain-containing protein [Planctomycetota bacterium]
MPIYTKDIRMHFDKLAQAVADGDCASVTSHAHALKGGGRNLSIEWLTETAAQMEIVARKNDSEASTRLFDGLKNNLDRIITVLSQSDWIEKAKILSTVASI